MNFFSYMLAILLGGGQCGVFRTFHSSLRVARNPEAGAPSAGSV